MGCFDILPTVKFLTHALNVINPCDRSTPQR